ncbi:Pyruvate/2-oxoglutarate dehydrogenase complex, dihydrolipoamide dehydrogenase (E3) component [Algoriphagus faecimaris]|uniref:Pyruvate/2-oxoglutarate dehydrogenase complex, dihydrolipoamide dehydrogenase (E3) component n=1 Tax=Algoriphagus faecimaris TaxID=686796 RepID=A0A1G6MV42_9BACT|nr:mercuric reductase [Algoriphagus faecimaris]SDC59488.1 Pyruvate/2-oxoglutarate dehydrogenase complex, dihydrolipoamide dehydrogenase (E3) component [Algoriphagus faecimaris]
MNKNLTFDSIIIGSGQAGNPLAFFLAAQGETVALVEKGKLGGTCVNTGCTPTKTYVASARRAWELTQSKRLGIHTSSTPEIDLKQIWQQKENLIDSTRAGLQQGLEENKQIKVFNGVGKFLQPNLIQVGDDQLEAKKIYINVGTRPRIIPGFENTRYFTNESILELKEIPNHLLIVGGSYVGLEFAQIFKRLGSKVTVLEKGERIIHQEDPDHSQLVQEMLEAEGVQFELHSTCLSGKNWGKSQVKVQIDCHGEKKAVRGSHLLLATGREPNTDLLQLELAKVNTDERGFIRVSEKLETNIKGIFALGDCNGKGAFTHTAFHDFEIIKDHVSGAKKKKIRDRILNYALYIDPPFARAGITKTQALNSNKSYLFAEMPMSQINRAKEKGEMQGKMEVLVEEKSGVIAGAMICGPGADEIIGIFLTAMYGNLHVDVLKNGVFTHPTVTELIPTLLQSLQPLKK